MSHACCTGPRAVLNQALTPLLVAEATKNFTQLDDESWIAGLDGTDGGSASALNANRVQGLERKGRSPNGCL